MNNIFDGIQRPLKTIADMTKSNFIPRGVSINQLDHDKVWKFIPNPDIAIGDLVSGGTQFGHVDNPENKYVCCFWLEHGGLEGFGEGLEVI